MLMPRQTLRSERYIDPSQSLILLTEAFVPILIPKSLSFYTDKAVYFQ